MAEVERRRYWPLAQMGVALLGIVALLVFYLLVALPIDLRLGTFLPDMSTLAVAIAMLLAIAWAEGHNARIAQAEARRLREAMARNLDGMPRADLKLPASEPGRQFDSADLSLLAGWQAWLGPIIVLAMAGFVVWAGVPILEHITGNTLRILRANPSHVIAFQPNLPPLMLSPFLSFTLLWGAVNGAIGMGKMALTCGFSIRLTDEGVMYSYVGQRARMLRWHEARLLEVTAGQAPANNGQDAHWQHTYTLYGERRKVTWIEDTGDLGVPSRRYAAWLELIRQRTGLEARTRSALLVPEGTTLPAPPVHANVGFITIGGLMLFALDLSIAEAPTSPTIAPYVPFEAFAVLVVFWGIWRYAQFARKWQADMASGRARAKALAAQATRSAPATPAAHDATNDLTYEYTYPTGLTSRQCRLLSLITSVFVLLGVGFIFVMTRAACYTPVGSLECLPYSPGGWAALLGIGGLGLLWAVSALRGQPEWLYRQTRAWVRAEPAALRASYASSPKRRRIPWRDIASLELVRMREDRWIYRVIDSRGLAVIRWMRGKPAATEPPSAPGSGAITVTKPAMKPLDADAFAALVAARGGCRIIERDERPAARRDSHT